MKETKLITTASVLETVSKSSKQKPAQKLANDVLSPPESVTRLLDAWKGSGWHQRCCRAIAANLLGKGIEQKDVSDWIEEHTPDDTTKTLLQKTALDLKVFGNAYWEIVRKGSEIIELYHAPAWTMYRLKDGGWAQIVNNERQVFSADDIFQFKTYGFETSAYGTPDYLAILPAVELLATIRKYNRLYFDNNAIPDFAIVVNGGEFAPEVEAKIQRFLRAKFKGVENAHKALYLPTPSDVTVKFEKLQSDTKDMQFLNLSADCVAEIIACHGVPPRLLGIMTPGQLGGGGETSGQMEIFGQTVIAPMQEEFTGQMMRFFKTCAGEQRDVSIVPFNYADQAADAVGQFIRGV